MYRPDSTQRVLKQNFTCCFFQHVGYLLLHSALSALTFVVFKSYRRETDVLGYIYMQEVLSK